MNRLTAALALLAIAAVALVANAHDPEPPLVYYHWRVVELMPGPLYGVWIEDVNGHEHFLSITQEQFEKAQADGVGTGSIVNASDANGDGDTKDGEVEIAPGTTMKETFEKAQ